MDIVRADFDRLEDKVDKLADAINRLVLVEERQSTQAMRIGAVEERAARNEANFASVDRKVDQWVNRGIGVWAVVVTLFAVYQAFRG